MAQLFSRCNFFRATYFRKSKATHQPRKIFHCGGEVENQATLERLKKSNILGDFGCRKVEANEKSSPN